MTALREPRFSLSQDSQVNPSSRIEFSRSTAVGRGAYCGSDANFKSANVDEVCGRGNCPKSGSQLAPMSYALLHASPMAFEGPVGALDAA
jgi:hypothetical protein